MLRFSRGLWQRLTRRAVKNGDSMNTEIIAALCAIPGPV
ncbi:MAG: Arc family DNA-binding protein [Bradyrhizobiaceae bacterium]|nr:Arc family DNA-binding protein [Bradyrhizobiaceae bacterium]